MSLFYDSNFLTVLSFAIFAGILWYFGVHKMLGKALDDRAERIRGELDRARALREEAQKKFAEIERKRAEVDGIAEEIVTKAREDAEAAAKVAKEDLAIAVERRLRAAEEQITMAEQSAMRAVHSQAVKVAVAAAADVMKTRMTDEVAGALVDRSVAEVGARLN
ncbi:MAG: ATP F0F1 synthase subunit B [Pseudomonadota bacterium]